MPGGASRHDSHLHRARDLRPDPGGPGHLAFCYHDDRQYLEVVRAFLRPALADGAPVLVAAPAGRLHLLRAGLAMAGSQVTFEDLSIAGQNPGRIIPGVLLPFADAHAGRRVWVVGEAVWPLRRPDAYSACVVHEALVNLVLADRDVVLLCAYDVRGLRPGAVRDVERTHPALHQGWGRRASRGYADPAATAAGSSPPLAAPPGHAAWVEVVDERSLTSVRNLIGRHAIDAGLPAATVQAVVLCVNELAANTIEHSGGPGRLSVWTDGQEPELVCQIDDTGHIADPLAGRVPPPWDAEGGRGLLLIHELSDLVLIHSSVYGTTIRVHFALPPDDDGPDDDGPDAVVSPRTG